MLPLQETGLAPRAVLSAVDHLHAPLRARCSTVLPSSARCRSSGNAMHLRLCIAEKELVLPELRRPAALRS